MQVKAHPKCPLQQPNLGKSKKVPHIFLEFNSHTAEIDFSNLPFVFQKNGLQIRTLWIYRRPGGDDKEAPLED